jgi:hypothetical protein
MKRPKKLSNDGPIHIPLNFEAALAGLARVTPTDDMPRSGYKKPRAKKKKPKGKAKKGGAKKKRD